MSEQTEAGRLKPNCTQVPNVILDKLMSILSPSQFKFVMAICRKTYGWHKRSDNISASQFQLMTGMSRRVIVETGIVLREAGLLITGKPGKRGMLNYSLNVDVDIDSLVQNLHRCKKVTSAENDLELVQNLHTQKKLIQKKERVAESDKLIPSHPSLTPNSKTKKANGATDPRVEPFLAWFANTYKERFGQPYDVRWGKDGKKIKELSKEFDVPKLQGLANRFFNSDDPWIHEKGGFTIGVFVSQINKLTSTNRAARRFVA